MKKLLILLFVALSNLTALSQKNKCVLSVDIGSSFPVGNYSKTDLKSNLSGFAKIGSSVSLSFAYKVSNNLELIAMVHLQKNGINTGAFESQLPNTQFNFTQGSPRYYPNWEVQNNSWLNKSGLLGISQKINKGHSNSKLSIHLKALGGITTVRSPKFFATSKSDTSYVEYTQNNTSASGFTFLLGSDVFYKVNKLISVKFSLDYLGTSQLTFKSLNEEIIATNGGLTIPKIYVFANSVNPILVIRNKYDAKQSISTINLRLGISFNL